MNDYTQFLRGGAKKLSASHLAALAKGREEAKKNKKKILGGKLLGNASVQDMVDTPQVMYAGNPLDVLRPIKPSKSESESINGNGKQKIKKVTKKVTKKKIIENPVESEDSEEEEKMNIMGEGLNDKHKKQIHKHVHEVIIPEAIKRLGNIAHLFDLTFIGKK
jgi:hypothetical protein